MEPSTFFWSQCTQRFEPSIEALRECVVTLHPEDWTQLGPFSLLRSLPFLARGFLNSHARSMLSSDQILLFSPFFYLLQVLFFWNLGESDKIRPQFAPNCVVPLRRPTKIHPEPKTKNINFNYFQINFYFFNAKSTSNLPEYNRQKPSLSLGNKRDPRNRPSGLWKQPPRFSRHARGIE